MKAPPKKGIVTRIRQYFKDVAAELKKVHWPARNELLTYTGVVLASVGILAALTWVVDSGLSFVMVELLGR
ncbi:MAG: preprotein translocase subunit SecE [Gracilibacteraceae bacterium]|nr:preprotein translocase subunit SecE [Gracilibacteraceae bacterium]